MEDDPLEINGPLMCPLSLSATHWAPCCSDSSCEWSLHSLCKESISPLSGASACQSCGPSRGDHWALWTQGSGGGRGRRTWGQVWPLPSHMAGGGSSLSQRAPASRAPGLSAPARQSDPQHSEPGHQWAPALPHPPAASKIQSSTCTAPPSAQAWRRSSCPVCPHKLKLHQQPVQRVTLLKVCPIKKRTGFKNTPIRWS